MVLWQWQLRYSDSPAAVNSLSLRARAPFLWVRFPDHNSQSTTAFERWWKMRQRRLLRKIVKNIRPYNEKQVGSVEVSRFRSDEYTRSQ